MYDKKDEKAPGCSPGVVAWEGAVAMKIWIFLHKIKT